ncbi:MAG: NACHT domain-containing protein [Deltaproteobacteria bacterium]|nr:NACHT domain-containing protein [Deltaproteobacteria bacterium]
MSKAFDFLEPYAALVRSARKALSYATDDPNHALIEVRKFGEHLTERLADAATPPVPQGTTYTRQAALRDRGILPPDIFAALDRCRRTGNEAVHGDQSDVRLVWRLLQDVHDIASWFVQLEGHPAPGPFVSDAHGTPLDAAEQERQLRERLSVDLRVPMSGFAARGRMEARDVDSLFVPPSFTDEPNDWLGLVEGARAGSRVVIGGAGGSGKSTLCRALARALLDEPNGPIPLLLPLAAVYDTLRGAIVRRVRDHLFVRLDGDVLEGWLESGRAVLILDGLDEARDPIELARTIEAMASAYKGLAVVVTGRPHMLSRLPIQSFQETWVKVGSPGKPCRSWRGCSMTPRRRRSSSRSGTAPGSGTS